MLNSMSKKIKDAEKTLVSRIKSKAGRKGVKMYKEVKANVIKPSLAKKTISGFSRGIEKERKAILDKKYQKVVAEWRASMLRLCLETVDAVKIAMVNYGHTESVAEEYSDRVFQRALIIKERLAAGKYDCMIDEQVFAIETLNAELIAASGMGLLEQKFYNSFINSDESLDSNDYRETPDDEYWDLEEDTEYLDDEVEDYELADEVYCQEETEEVHTPDEDEVLEKARIHLEEVRGKRLNMIVDFLEDHEDDKGFDYSGLKFLRRQIKNGEGTLWSDDYFEDRLNKCISVPEQNSETAGEAVEEKYCCDSTDLEDEEESSETSDIPETIPETAGEAIEAAVKEVLAMDNESNRKYPAKKKGRKPANAEEQ